MSDLQCPARFVLVCAPDATTAESLRHERVAAVYDGPPAPGATLLGATLLGDALRLPVQVITRTLVVDEVLARRTEALDELRDLADLHRGETVVITAVGRPGQRVDVAVDGDGVTLQEISQGAAT